MKLTDTKLRLLQCSEHIVIGYREQKQSLRYLADIYETSAGSIRTLLIEEGVELRARGRKRKENQ